MAQTITPVGHGGRGARWAKVIALHLVGATASAALLGAALGAAGAASVASGDPAMAAVVVGTFGVARSAAVAAAWLAAGDRDVDALTEALERLALRPGARILNGVSLAAVAVFGALAATSSIALPNADRIAPVAASVLALVFGLAAASKTARWGNWRRALATYRIPAPRVTAIVVPVAEAEGPLAGGRRLVDARPAPRAGVDRPHGPPVVGALRRDLQPLRSDPGDHGSTARARRAGPADRVAAPIPKEQGSHPAAGGLHDQVEVEAGVSLAVERHDEVARVPQAALGGPTEGADPPGRRGRGKSGRDLAEVEDPACVVWIRERRRHARQPGFRARVRAGAAVDRVDAALAEQVVVAVPAGHGVVPVAAVQQIGPPEPRQDVRASVAPEHVVAGRAGQPLDPDELIRARPGGRPRRQIGSDAARRGLVRGDVEPVAAVELVVSLKAVEHVVAAVPAQDVGARGPGEHVVRLGPLDGALGKARRRIRRGSGGGRARELGDRRGRGPGHRRGIRGRGRCEQGDREERCRGEDGRAAHRLRLRQPSPPVTHGLG